MPKNYKEITDPDEISGLIGISAYVETDSGRFDLGNIPMARRQFLQNYAQGMEEVIIIRSFLNGLGGDVHIVPGIMKDLSSKLSEEDVFTDDNFVGDIGPNKPFTKIVYGSDQQLGVLTLSHVGFTLN